MTRDISTGLGSLRQGVHPEPQIRGLLAVTLEQGCQILHGCRH